MLGGGNRTADSSGEHAARESSALVISFEYFYVVQPRRQRVIRTFLCGAPMASARRKVQLIYVSWHASTSDTLDTCVTSPAADGAVSKADAILSSIYERYNCDISD